MTIKAGPTKEGEFGGQSDRRDDRVVDYLQTIMKRGFFDTRSFEMLSGSAPHCR